MNSDHLTTSHPTLPEDSPATGTVEVPERAWLKPMHNPQRSALVASACEQLLEASRRIAALNAKIAELTQQAA